MAKIKKISPLKICDYINEELQRYSADIQYGIIELTDEAADKMCDELERRSPKRTKKYSKSWTVKLTKDTFTSYINHLFEDGHKTRNGKMTRRQRHITPVVDEIHKEYTENMKKLIQSSSRNGGGRRF